eukprot:CAMPEP_0116125822 /NCGR_PEP_ID=MMETSP0329-20121206/6010_1 /TAXON_ID=697910 /ORGANISM="Pseudo-nitzschia arenysensis, Strain B593" /LENGTH=192 /DNA_ID=CAMNT_0003619877 /DNA_START=316 /DNA_END=894 /DNA_ORIENTATION=-
MGASETSATGQHHSVFESPCDSGKAYAQNPYDYMPQAPPRVRGSVEGEIDFPVFASKKPVSDGIFLDLDMDSKAKKKKRAYHDSFSPIASAPALQPRRMRKPKLSKPIPKKGNAAYHDSFSPIAAAPALQPRRMRKPELSKPIPKKGNAVASVPELSVAWVRKRPLVLRAGGVDEPVMVLPSAPTRGCRMPL